MDTPTPAPLRCPASRPHVVPIMTMRMITGPNCSIIIVIIVVGVVVVVLLHQQGAVRC